MYYKLLIVDDEKTILEGLKTVVDWNELGFEIIGEASNGIEALSFIHNNGCPDAVLADIRMPLMDGLELMKCAREEGYNFQFIILSGYDHFEYVQKAIELGAFNYILKPTKLDELKEKFKALKEKLDEEQKKNIIIQKGFKSIEENCLKMLLNDKYEQIESELKNLRQNELFSEGNIYAVSLMRPILEERLGNLIEIRENVFKDACFPCNFITTADDSGNLVIVFYTNELVGPDAFDKNIEATIKDMIGLLHKAGYHARVGIGNIVGNIKELHISYRNAVLAINKSFFAGRDAVVKYTKVAEPKPGSLDFYKEYETRLISSIEQGDKDEAFKIIDQLFNEFVSVELIQPEYVYKICIELILAISRSNKNISASIEEVFDERRIIYNRITQFETLEQLKDWFKARISIVIDIILDMKDNTNNRIVNHIKKIISRDYQKQISLISIANELYMNPDYLSRLFKKGVGKSFVEYLTEYRIEKAKQLLRDVSCKSYEVAYMVGFNEPSYFSKVF
ncbi:MAG TPA: response regulator, partial [Clostridiaceae bacterium]|nr:response regulator [Clostridiaceae bacterium]